MLRKFTLSLFALAFLAGSAHLHAQSAGAPFDLVIRGGRLVDGSGNPWHQADVGVRDGRVVAIGRLEGRPARRVIDAQGLVVAPGFIDMLGQSEFTLLVDGRAESKIRQGITTEITGEGESIAPVNDAILADWKPFLDHYGLKVDWRRFRGYFARLEKQGTAINLGSYVGATQVREMVLGHANRAPTPAELERMKQLVAEAMEDGALGLSTSLVYAPAFYARTDELVALARVASAAGGIYATHMRNEGNSISEALDEAIRIGLEAHIPVEIFHLKVAGKPNWGKMGQVTQQIHAAREAGVDIAADTYSYTAGATALAASIPPWAHEGGIDKMLARLRDPATRQRLKAEIERPAKDWENFYYGSGGASGVLISSVLNPTLKPFEGKRLDEIARLRKQEPLDALFELVIEDGAQTGAIYFLMDEPDVEAAIRAPWVSFGCDCEARRTDGILGEFKPHPRCYGNFPRILGRYVREKHLLSLEEAVRKMTSLAAERVGLMDRGLIKEGLWADITIFDPSTVRDVATYENPNQYAEGIRYVIVNGQLVLDDGKMTGALPGRVLRGPAWAAPYQRAGLVRGASRILDLTYALNDHIPHWPGDKAPFTVTIEETIAQNGYFTRRFSMLEHYGTHMDAPAHFVSGQATVDAVPPERLIVPAVVVDISAQATRDPDYRLTVEDLRQWEQQHGRIPARAVVFLRTGWGDRWNDPARYANQDASGVMHFPGFSLAAAEFLTKERDIAGLGIDTLSVDYGPSKEFEVHHFTHAAGLYHLENVANLEQLPATGTLVIVAPIKLEGGSGGPTRIFALVP